MVSSLNTIKVNVAKINNFAIMALNCHFCLLKTTLMREADSQPLLDCCVKEGLDVSLKGNQYGHPSITQKCCYCVWSAAHLMVKNHFVLLDLTLQLQHMVKGC